MKILNPQQISALDKYTIEHEPITSIDLMQRAANYCGDWILKNISNTSFYIFAGTGNNGGDGLALTRIFNLFPFKKKAFLVKISDNLSIDAKINQLRLQETDASLLTIIESIEEIDFSQIEPDAVIIDSIFGSGLNRPTEGLAKQLIDKINQLPNKIISIDIPSGLFAEYDNNYSNKGQSIIKADITLTFQTPKLSFLLPENDDFIGEWHVLDIELHPEYIKKQKSEYILIESEQIKSIRKKRAKNSHKGNFGHALLIAGSYGKMGAAVLASSACLKAGVGLLTAHIPHWGYNIIQTTVPEAMTSIDRSEMFFTEFPDLNGYNAIGIGPGLGKKKNSVLAFEDMLNTIENQAFVIDADGLNIISENKHLFKKLPKDCILTPHPKEFERLVGTWNNDMHKLELLKKFCEEYELITVLKGAHSIICLSDATCYFNCTGNPGMATAGSGDVLTGIILALLAQGYTASDAAIFGVYIHGKAGDLVLEHESEESLTASDIISSLGAAFKTI